MMRRSWGWIAYALAWLLAAALWALAAATGARISPLTTLPTGLYLMGFAATMGLIVWRITGRVPWRSTSIAFWAIHAAGMLIYAVAYSTFSIWLEHVRQDVPSDPGLRSAVLLWNTLMGSWLYLIVAGLSYVVRAERRASVESAAADRARLTANQAQLAALRARLNPHFLFNALHSVGALVASDPQAADEAIERLGDLLRYTLTDQDHVPLSSEWRFTTDYVAFERLRLGDRLITSFDVDDDALDVQVPALVLQPLVENAVRHGIAACPEGGRLSISARLDGSRLIMRVTDTGPGSAAAHVQDGMGMSSLRRRLESRYGDRASIGVDTGVGRGYAVTVTLPVERALAGAAPR